MGRIGLPELLLLFFLTVPYFVPTIIAMVRHKTNLLAIFMVNLLLGWTIIGWIVALVWAVAKETVDVQADVTAVAQPSRFCRSCGKYSPAGSNYCGQCGQAFT